MPLFHDVTHSGARLLAGCRRAWLPMVVSLVLAGQAQAANLLTVTQDALENDADLASARARFSSVEVGRDVSRGALLPQVSAGVEAAHQRTYSSQRNGIAAGASGAAAGVDDAYNRAGASLQASQALFDVTRWAQLERSDRLIDQQRFSLAAAEQQVLRDAASAYFEILRANDILEARQAQERAIERQLEQAREQFEVGLIAITDVEEAEAAFDLARAERIGAQSALEVSFEALERLTGLRYDSIDGLSAELPVELPQPSSREQWVELAMQHSPVLAQAQAAVEVSRSDVEVAKGARLPVVEAFANYEYADSDSEVLSGHDSSSQVGLQASLPLYTGGSTLAQIRQNTFLLESAQYDAEAQRRDTIQQVRSSFTLVSNDVQTVEARRQAVVSNQSALDATRAGYEVGTRNIVDVLSAERNLSDAIAAYAEARYDYVLDLLALRQQAGTLDLETIEAVNAWLSSEEGVALELAGMDPGDAQAAMNIGRRPQPPQ